MTVKKFRSQLNYVMQFMPFRLNFFIFGALAFLIYYFVSENKTDTSSFYGFLILMSKIAVWLIVILVSLSVISTFIAWLYYRKSSNTLTLEFFEKENKKGINQLQLKAVIPNIIKPILGTINAKFIYNDLDLSQQFILHKKNTKRFFSLKPGVKSTTKIDLPDIKEYNFKGALIYFEDLFRFFSLASFTTLNEQFNNLPKNLKQSNEEVDPKATNEEKIRIQKLRKMDGEWLEYKKFEAADDIRRIVWKVFAKNRELMVRKQEVLNPFASHIYFYLSFYNTNSKALLHPEHLQIMANYYKNISWTILNELEKQAFKIKLVVDQAANTEQTSKENPSAERISQCQWQENISPQEWYDKKKGSVLVIHSLIGNENLNVLLDKCDHQTKIFYVDISKPFESHAAMNWLKMIFIKPAEDELTQLQQTWPFSTMRILLNKENEKNKQTLENAIADIEFI